MTEYAGGISRLAPLDEAQERALLFAKLRHKQWYETALREAGFYREDLPAAGREYARQAAEEALEHYRQNYLMEIRPFLDERQFTLLSNYETTEYDRRLKQLLRPD